MLTEGWVLKSQRETELQPNPIQLKKMARDTSDVKKHNNIVNSCSSRRHPWKDLCPSQTYCLPSYGVQGFPNFSAHYWDGWAICMEQSKSILGSILEKATQRSFSTSSCDLYLFFMYVRAEKVFSHKYASLVNQSGLVRWSASWDPCSIRNMCTSSRSSYRPFPL